MSASTKQPETETTTPVKKAEPEPDGDDDDNEPPQQHKRNNNKDDDIDSGDGPVPVPALFVIGVTIGLLLQRIILPFTEYLIPLSWSTLTTTTTTAPPEQQQQQIVESLLIELQALGLLSPLFIYEFLVAATARATSPDQSPTADPVKLEATGSTPIKVVLSNRILRNHVESAFMFVPAVLAATASGADCQMVVACTISWVLSRVLYRAGYASSYPIWRTSGLASAQIQTFTCLFLLAKTKMVWEK